MMNGPWRVETLEPTPFRGGTLRLLVTGVDGPIGGNIAWWMARRANVTGLYGDIPVAFPNCQIERWEAAVPATLSRHIRETKPHWIIHCGPVARPSWDLADASHQQPVSSATHERAICRTLVRESQRLDARLTVLTTDAVFAGPRIFHDEQSAVAGRHRVVRMAMAVERALEGSGALVIRTCAYGWSPCDDRLSFAEKAWLAATEGAPYAIDPQAHATPILATDLAGLLWQSYRQGLRGVRHVAGAERVNACRFALELASLAGQPRPDAAIQGAPPNPPPRARLQETSLDSRTVRQELNCPMPMLREGLARFVDQMGDGTRAQLRGRAVGTVASEAA